MRWIIGVAAAALVALAGCDRLVDSLAQHDERAPRAAASEVLFAGPPTTTEAARFLTQASFGPTDASIAAVQAMGYDGWIKQQLAMPPSGSHLAWVDARVAEGANNNNERFYESFWMRAATGPDELRQRVAFALSEIFVISLNNPRIDSRGAGSYYDVLSANAFGSYRTLLEEVSLHPMMGT
jgi:uncharacterized protein (DUF1800 family)